jgi:hypothetical protein
MKAKERRESYEIIIKENLEIKDAELKKYTNEVNIE